MTRNSAGTCTGAHIQEKAEQRKTTLQKAAAVKKAAAGGAEQPQARAVTEMSAHHRAQRADKETWWHARTFLAYPQEEGSPHGGAVYTGVCPGPDPWLYIYARISGRAPRAFDSFKPEH